MRLKDETHIKGHEIMKPEQGRPSWKNRKKVIFTSLMFCAFCILFIMFQGNDTRVNESIVLGCFALAGSIIGFYVAGAAWTDVNIEKIKSNNIDGSFDTTNNQEPDTIHHLSDGKGPDD